jgi:surfactin synthase thioesterase subunit
VFRTWPDGLSDQVEVRGVMLPGRERRFNEPALTSVSALADLLVPALSGEPGPPYAIFGHSLGAVLAFEVARRLSAAGQAPVHLLVSGGRAPHLARTGPVYHRLPDAEFLASVNALGGTPPELVANQEFLELLLPTLRADFTAAETYRVPLGRPLPCPITAFGGAGDPMVARADLDAWAGHAGGAFRVHVLPGDHFFLTTARARLLELVDRELAPYVERRD